MSSESLDFAYHRGVDNKFTYTLNLTQILLILCKPSNKVYLIKMFKHQAQTRFGTKLDSMCSAFEFDTGFTSRISIFKADAKYFF